jgi:small multidrug resistance family-3 protein
VLSSLPLSWRLAALLTGPGFAVGNPPRFTLLGIISLCGFALALTRVDSAFAGRAYAAYGGIYIAAPLGWLWLVGRQRPTVTDLLGVALAIAGALITIGFAPRQG